MTRGKQKIEAQKRANEKKVKEPQSQLAARQAGINFVCNVCKSPLANAKQGKEHYEAKHPKSPIPPEIASA